MPKIILESIRLFQFRLNYVVYCNTPSIKLGLFLYFFQEDIITFIGLPLCLRQGSGFNPKKKKFSLKKEKFSRKFPGGVLPQFYCNISIVKFKLR
jgi:hypothetical protein